VARRAQVSHQAPYHYFKSDTEILGAIAQEGFIKLGNAMKDASSQMANKPIDALNAAGIAYVMFAQENLGYFRVMFQRSLLPKDLSISDLIEAQEARQALKDLVNEVINLGVVEHLGLDGLTMLCWSTAHGLATLLSEGLTSADQDKISEAQITRQVIEALGGFLVAKK